MSFLGLLKYSAPFKISYIIKVMCSSNFTILNNIKHFITKFMLRSFVHKVKHFSSVLLNKYSKKVICRYYLKRGKQGQINFFFLTAMKTFAILSKIKENMLKTAGLPGVDGRKTVSYIRVYVTEILPIYVIKRRKILVYLICLRLTASVIQESLLTLKRSFLIINKTCMSTVL